MVPGIAINTADKDLADQAEPPRSRLEVRTLVTEESAEGLFLSFVPTSPQIRRMRAKGSFAASVDDPISEKNRSTTTI